MDEIIGMLKSKEEDKGIDLSEDTNTIKTYIIENIDLLVDEIKGEL